MNYKRGVQFLESQGINLFHAFDTTDIAEIISNAVPNIELDRFPTTVLIANAGYVFWQSMRAANVQDDNPVDQYSILLSHEFAKKYLHCDIEILYPSDYPLSLQSVGQKTGWSHTTPMGISIHPTFGTWFAYRALFLVEQKLPATAPLVADHPCESCLDRPCQRVCPSGAVGEIGSFKLETCGHYRIEHNSSCAYQCLSRISCPVGVEYQYVPEQMNYHYNRSRTTLLRYFGAQTQD